MVLVNHDIKLWLLQRILKFEIKLSDITFYDR
nr:MAG TPA: hypothetical protein [Bacteriophage sp.]